MTVSCRSKSTVSSHCRRLGLAALGAAMALLPSATMAQAAGSGAATSGPAPAVSGTTVPASYVIGPEDVLSIVFWRDKDMSVDVIVRPDGKISVPLLNDVDAAGLTPEQLRSNLAAAAKKYIEDPSTSVVVKEIHSRKVFVTGKVTKAGTFPLTGDMTVLQVIALAGGLLEYADSKNIAIIRSENGKQEYHKFNYNDVVKQKHVEQNISLKPGDTVVVP